MTNHDFEDQVLKVLQDLEKVLDHCEATHAVVVIYNSREGESVTYIRNLRVP